MQIKQINLLKMETFPRIVGPLQAEEKASQTDHDVYNAGISLHIYYALSATSQVLLNYHILYFTIS